uniref:Uncharacterized protein n=1 Tax=Nothobranchius kuhntae TaxID=321403 RepID=A0A1A8K3D1_NOTKU
MDATEDLQRWVCAGVTFRRKEMLQSKPVASGPLQQVYVTPVSQARQPDLQRRGTLKCGRSDFLPSASSTDTRIKQPFVGRSSVARVLADPAVLAAPTTNSTVEDDAISTADTRERRTLSAESTHTHPHRLRSCGLKPVQNRHVEASSQHLSS